MRLAIAVLILGSQAWGQFSGRYGEVVKRLQFAQAKYPENSKLITLGKSDSEEEVIGLQIGNGKLQNLLVGTHHGNEYGSTEVAVSFAETLASDPIKDQTIFVFPVLNISGYNKNARRENYARTTQDPNRDYPGPCATEGPFKLKSTRSLAQFIASHNIVTSATLHTYSPSVLYPWGISTHDTQTPYESMFIQLGQFATSFSGYAVGNSTELLYPADGTFEDFAYWEYGIWSLLFEMGSTHSPNSKQLAELVAKNVPGLRKLFENSLNYPAEDHEFHGKCDVRLRSLDLRDE